MWYKLEKPSLKVLEMSAEEARVIGPPVKPGYYWLRQDYVNRATRGVVTSAPQIVMVLLDYKPGRRKADAEKILLVSYSGCRQPLSELTNELCHWSEEITCPPLS